ncbi:branched-chain amino acid ABC transporter permease, partial [Nocardioides sp.]|uniref:branched-chain amino acid ABC transporter permease n=1 Tax=Nocardioides sp. TaxID=35761 RepID=UPI002735002C
VLVSALFGWAQDRGLWRPLRRRGTGLIAMMIVSIGFGLLLRNVYQYTITSSRKSLSQYVSQGRNDYGPISLADKELAIIVVATVTITVTCVVLMKTRLGKAMRAVSDNPALSASSGMRVDGVIGSVWILGTALTGLAGVLLAVNSQVNFLMGFKLLLLVFAAVTLGGLGTIWGALFGSMVIGIMVEVGPLFGVPSSIKEVGALVVLILVLLIRPQGILGRRERVG